MNIPNQLPILSSGKQAPGSGQVCAEQAVNWLVSGRMDLGDETDHPDCVQPVLNALAIRVNDELSDRQRVEMWPIILRQPGTAHPEMEPILSIRLACFLAEKVLHLVGPGEWEACRDAIVATQVYCANPTAENANLCSAAATAAYAAASVATSATAANAATYAATSATAATAAANAAEYDAATANAAAIANAAYAANAAAYAAYAATGSDDALLQLLSAAQDECERLTGHVPQACDTTRIERLTELVGAS